MIGQYKQALALLKDRLNSLKKDQQNLEKLLQLQLMIIRFIKRIEERSQNLKKLQKSTSAARNALFIFKSFGDAIPFLYISRFNLKQLSFNLDSERLKNDSGFISGKRGFEIELNQLETYLRQGYPGMLCDISNSIRYGDILMLFEDSDPLIIECKLAKQNDQRSRRQGKKLKQLADFYLNDKKTIKKGLIQVDRVESQLPLVEYSKRMNALIELARVKGAASEEVEQGLYYIASFNHLLLDEQLRELKLAKPWITNLNMEMSNHNWISYLPLALSIERSEDFVDFVVGRLVLIVIVELQSVSRALPKDKAQFVLNETSEHPFEFYLYEKGNKNASGMFAIAAHMIRRVPLEFVSIRWIVQNSYHTWIAGS